MGECLCACSLEPLLHEALACSLCYALGGGRETGCAILLPGKSRPYSARKAGMGLSLVSRAAGTQWGACALQHPESFLGSQPWKPPEM